MTALVTRDKCPDPMARLPDDTLVPPPKVAQAVADYLRAQQETDPMWRWSPSEYLPELADLHAALVGRQKVTAPTDIIADWLINLSKAVPPVPAEHLADRSA
jgi:hypothetical protein